MTKLKFLTFVFCIIQHHNFMHKAPTFFLCHRSPYLPDSIAKPLRHHKLFRFFFTTIPKAKIFLSSFFSSVNNKFILNMF